MQIDFYCQCSKCKINFNGYLFSNGEGSAEVYLSRCVVDSRGEVIHRPKVCGGVVKLINGFEICKLSSLYRGKITFYG